MPADQNFPSQNPVLATPKNAIMEVGFAAGGKSHSPWNREHGNLDNSQRSCLVTLPSFNGSSDITLGPTLRRHRPDDDVHVRVGLCATTLKLGLANTLLQPGRTKLISVLHEMKYTHTYMMGMNRILVIRGAVRRTTKKEIHSPLTQVVLDRNLLL